MTGKAPSVDLSEADVAGMVAHLRPAWEITDVEIVPEGVNSTALLTVDGDTGTEQVVLKAGTIADELIKNRTRAEPRLLSLVERETALPVPSVFAVCDDHETYPSPFFLMEYLDGETLDSPDPLTPAVRETTVREAGRNLAELHRLGPLPSAGTIGYQDGELAILDTEEKPKFDEFHDWFRHSCERTLDRTEDQGGLFPELTDDPNRFDDLLPDLRRYVRETIPALSEPAPLTYCHKDYGYTNLRIDPSTGETVGVIDWGLCMSAPPAFNLALAEANLLRPEYLDEPFGADGRGNALRRLLWESYAQARADWTLDEATVERINAYRMLYRITAMACLPEWHSTSESRDRRAAAHREFVRDELDRRNVTTSRPHTNTHHPQ